MVYVPALCTSSKMPDCVVWILPTPFIPLESGSLTTLTSTLPFDSDPKEIFVCPGT